MIEAMKKIRNEFDAIDQGFYYTDAVRSCCRRLAKNSMELCDYILELESRLEELEKSRDKLDYREIGVTNVQEKENKNESSD